MSNPQTTRPEPERGMWRVDVAGYPVTVEGRYAKEHLERVNRQNAKMKMALHRIKSGREAFDPQLEAIKALQDD